MLEIIIIPLRRMKCVKITPPQIYKDFLPEAQTMNNYELYHLLWLIAGTALSFVNQGS